MLLRLVASNRYAAAKVEMRSRNPDFLIEVCRPEAGAWDWPDLTSHFTLFLALQGYKYAVSFIQIHL